MPTSDLDQEKARQEREFQTQRQIAFASGIFQENVTVHTLLESLAEGVVIIDKTGTILLVNTRAGQMFGYPKEELIGKPHSILIPERFRKVHEDYQAQFFAEPRISLMGQRHDLAGRRRDGSEFPAAISLSFMETLNGVLVLAFVSDITLRKQYESSLRESEELFRIQVECVRDYAIFMLDARGNVLNWNAGAERLKGYREEEIIGKHFSCLYPEEERDAGKPADELRRAAAEGRIADEGWRVRKDGSRFWADVIITALHDEGGNLRGFSLVTRDITERRRAEETLRNSEQQLVEAQRLAQVGSWEWDIATDTVIWSCELYDIFGLKSAKRRKSYRDFLRRVHRDDRAETDRIIRTTYAEMTSMDFHHRIVRPDGDVRILHSRGQVAAGPDGKPARMIGACQDVTELKSAEEALRRSEQKFSLAFQSTPTVLVIASLADGRYLEVNESFERVMGYRRNEVIGRSALEINIWQDPEDRAMVLRMLAQGAKVRDLEIGFRRKSGTLLIGLYSAEIIEIGTEKCLLSMVNDITARKKAEEELRRSEERYRRLYNETPVMLHSIDHDGRLVSVSDYWLESLGYERGEVLGRKTTEFLTEASRRYATEVVLPEFFRTGFCREVPYQFVKKNGEVLDVYLSAIAEKDTGEKVVRSLAVMVDVTERKRAEEEREQLLVQLDAVLSSINEGVIISDLEGNVLTMNPAALAINGYESVDQVRRQLHQFQGTFEMSGLDGRPVPFEQWPLSRALRGERFTDYEVRVRRTDTGKSWIGSFSGTAAQTTSGNVILAVVTLRDITEHNQAEEALRKSELKFSRIFHSVPELIAISTQAEGKCIDINETGLRTLGYRREEVIGRTAMELGIWGSRAERDKALRVLEENGMVRNLEINFRSKNGTTYTGLLFAEPIDFDGERYLLNIVNDITDRKLMEEEIEKLNTDLAARAAELESANQELEAFNYTVAHDLRKPLTVINGYCELIREQCGVKLDVACRGYLRETNDGIWRMNRLIDALLNFSRLAHVEPHRITVDLSTMAHEVAAELKQSEPGRRVMLSIADGIHADGDPALLRVVLDNLLGNAWKYTGTRDEGIVEFGTTEVNGKPAWFVRDNGTGFDMAHADKLFEPFHRLPGAEECRGFGIGLATVERIIRRHGGKLWAEGEPGKGATFYFTL